MGLCLTLKENETIYFWKEGESEKKIALSLSLIDKVQKKAYLKLYFNGSEETVALTKNYGHNNTVQAPMIIVGDGMQISVTLSRFGKEKIRLMLSADKSIQMLQVEDTYEPSFDVEKGKRALLDNVGRSTASDPVGYAA